MIPILEAMGDKAHRRVLFIRAVNVGGAKMPMAELRALATDLGATDVTTYIASGNLLCTPAGDAGEFDRALEAAIEQRFRFFREVISRTPEQLRDALAAHPFEVVDDRLSHIHFLSGEPAAHTVRALGARDFAGDEHRVIGPEVHIRYQHGAGRSGLTARTISTVLRTPGTARNLNTVGKLIELA